jgi:uncharacterized protein
MAQRTDVFDLSALGLTPGEGRRLDLNVGVDAFDFGGQEYRVAEALVPVRLEISKMTSGGHALRLAFTAELAGPCQRCLEPASPGIEVDAREVDQPGGPPASRAEPDDLSSPYVDGSELDLHAWARDALALAMPSQIVCRDECAGLCPVCGTNLNEAGAEHAHESAPDPRWSKLRELE